MRPVIMDVDTGIDDALALLYAVASPEVDLAAVTCVAGNVDLETVSTNTAAILDLAGRPDIEVAAGADRPLVRSLQTTPETHGPSGVGYATLATSPGRISSRHAVDVIIESARDCPGEMTVVALGPLTNLALAIEREPALPRLLRDVVVMGGCFNATGNTAPRTEWNVHVDPEAARAFYRGFGIPGGCLPLVMPLDVTENARLYPEHVARLAAAAGSRLTSLTSLTTDGGPLLSCVVDALRFYMEFHAEYDGFYGAFVHDPFAMAAALEPDLVEAVPVTVDVELAGELTTGETVGDWRHHWGRPANARVAVRGNAEAFFERLIDRVGAHIATCDS